MAQLILQGERAVPAVAAVLLGPPSSIAEPRCLAAEILGAIGGEAALSALIRALTIHDVRRLDPVLRLAEEAVRNRAAEQLGKLGNRRAIGPLIYALAREGVRGAMGALAQFGEPGGIRYVVRRLEDPCDRVAAADAVLRYGRIAVPDLAATLNERKPSAEEEAPMSRERRAEAARLLGVLGDDRVIPTLEAYLEDSAPAVRLEAALARLALSRADVPDGVLRLVAENLGHANMAVAERCMDALVSMGDRSIPHLVAVAGPRVARPRGSRQPSEDAHQVAAIQVLQRLGTEASAHALEGFIRDVSPLVRGCVWRALGRSPLDSLESWPRYARGG